MRRWYWIKNGLIRPLPLGKGRTAQTGEEMDETVGRKIDAEIANLIAQTGKLNAETQKVTAEARWYPFVVLAGVFGAAIAIVKLFLS